ncbi:MAG: ornithine carbamoyltransferase [Planctomycetes bacterium]|nr:ornithine carbamoyltransferase [Planctomycetota bacterium]
MKTRGRLSVSHLVSDNDLTPADVALILKTAVAMKKAHRAGRDKPVLRGKVLGMIFQKSSTRTRVSFEVAMLHLGGSALYLSANDLQLGRGETIADTARVLSRYVDGIMARTYAHSDVEALARFGSVPVINGLTDLLHPCQILADLLTIHERRGLLKGRRLAYVGDGNNVAHSLMIGCAKAGMQCVIGAPRGYHPRPEILVQAEEAAAKTGGSVEVVVDPREAAEGADVLYTDVWASMGQEKEHEARKKILAPYQLNAALVARARKDCLVMHCLPAHRGEEITDEVVDGTHSVVWDQAENRLHAQKAVLALLMGGDVPLS